MAAEGRPLWGSRREMHGEAWCVPSSTARGSGATMQREGRQGEPGSTPDLWECRNAAAPAAAVWQVQGGGVGPCGTVPQGPASDVAAGGQTAGAAAAAAPSPEATS
mmetsp:Transcript_53221/g.158637  ORF Transcript_53221/g.158637 Transcript_53221/m.158637 type:complete len:106 (+) Transcript_53221:687-1004(+)